MSGKAGLPTHLGDSHHNREGRAVGTCSSWSQSLLIHKTEHRRWGAGYNTIMAYGRLPVTHFLTYFLNNSTAQKLSQPSTQAPVVENQLFKCEPIGDILFKPQHLFKIIKLEFFFIFFMPSQSIIVLSEGRLWPGASYLCSVPAVLSSTPTKYMGKQTSISNNKQAV